MQAPYSSLYIYMSLFYKDKTISLKVGTFCANKIYKIGEKSMKYQKLIKESTLILDSIVKQQRKRQKKIESYLEQVKVEEQNLRKQLKREKNKTQRKKLNKKLIMVKKAYVAYGT